MAEEVTSTPATPEAGNGNGSKFAVIFQKQGRFSITRTILVVAWTIALFKYLFAGLTLEHAIADIGAHKSMVKVAWTITFNGADAISILGAASTLYFANHNISYRK
jgi:hypothetical protein